MIKFVKWIDEQPINPQKQQRLFIKNNGKLDVIIYIVAYGETLGSWCWNLAWNDSKGKRITKEEFIKFEWLNEDYKAVATSLDSCPFNYCDSNPKCEGKCRYV
jgi:hypothetical protein